VKLDVPLNEKKNAVYLKECLIVCKERFTTTEI